MIQELLGGGVGGGGEDRKIPVTGAGVVVEGSSSSSSSSSENQNLRCPRCDSSNTKFCYYNNYNLTQPRHFCKTCRRYWTKGGALRNVPIGGGCRKNKGTSTSTASSSGKSSSSKQQAIKPMPSDVGKPSLGNGFDHEHSSSPLLWPPQSQNSPLLALLRAAQNPNPNPSSAMVKEERVLIGSHMGSSESTVMSSALNARNLNLDPSTHVPFTLSNSFWRNNQQQLQQQQILQQNPHQNSMLFGEAPNSGIQDLYHRIRFTTNYYNDHSPAGLLSNGTTSSTSSIMEPASMTTGQLGYWNLPFSSWSDLPTTNGAFP